MFPLERHISDIRFHQLFRKYYPLNFDASPIHRRRSRPFRRIATGGTVSYQGSLVLRHTEGTCQLIFIVREVFDDL